MKMAIVKDGKTTKEYGISLEDIAPILESKDKVCHLFFKGDEEHVMMSMTINEFYDLKKAIIDLEYDIDRYVFGQDDEKEMKSEMNTKEDYE